MRVPKLSLRAFKALPKYAFIVAVLIFLPTINGSVIHAAVKSSGLAKVKGEGFRSCRTLVKDGYVAIVRGDKSGGGTNNKFSAEKFNLRYCFESNFECNEFIKNIKNILWDVAQFNYTQCKKR